METLAQIYARHVAEGCFCDRNTVHSYIPYYEELLAPRRDTAKRVLEIGLFDGGGLKIWENYFHNAKVYGIDCDERPHGGLADLRPLMAEKKLIAKGDSPYFEPAHLISILDATNQAQVKARFWDDIRFDLIFDDAAHHLEQQLQLWEVWRHYLAPNALYVVEDLQSREAMGKFKEMGFEIVDRRGIKGRYDDVLAVWRKPA